MLPIIFILFLGVSIFLTAILVRQRQEIRKKASVPQGVATIRLSPETGTYAPDQSFPVSIYFNTAGISVSGIALRITYPYTGTSPELEASNIQINPDLLLSGDWVCPVKTITPENGVVKIDIACVNTNIAGFSVSTDTLLASFNLQVRKIPATSPMVLNFDPELTVIKQKSNAQNILGNPTSSGIYNIGGTLPETTTPIPSGSTPTPTQTPTPTPTSSPTPTSACNCVRVKLYDTNNKPLNLSQIIGGQTIRIFIEGTGKDQWQARVRINQGSWKVTTNYIYPLGYHLDWTIPSKGGFFNVKGEINCSGTWKSSPDCHTSFIARGGEEGDREKPEFGAGDFNNDEKIDNYDLNFLLLNWGKIEADLNQDGTTNEKDLAFLLANWSPQ